MQINGRYTIEKKLGAGASGDVFLVRDALRKGLPVALKVLHKNSLSPEMLKTLQREYVTLQQFDHPNFVHVFDFGRIVTGDPEAYRGDFFLTMEYLEGTSLLDATKDASWELHYELVFQLAMALDYIHHHGLIHFDIKPQNIIVTNVLLEGQAVSVARIIDFGFAASSLEGVPESVRGSLAYLAPELLSGRPFDHRVDLYSLGATLFEAICRRPPFSADDPLGLIKAHLLQPVPSILAHRSDAPSDLAELISWLLEKNPDQRCPNASNIVQRVRDRAKRIHRLYSTPYSAPSKKMVGRREELASLLDFLRRAIGMNKPPGFPEEKKIACLISETGMGKTRLLEELKRHAQIDEILFFETHCYSTISPPFEPFRIVLRDLTFALKMFGNRGEEVLTRFNQILTTLVPDVVFESGQSTPMSFQSKESRILFLDFFSRMLAEASTISPFAIWIDDIEQADDASLELIQFLLRTLSRSPIAFFLTAESLEKLQSVLKKRIDAAIVLQLKQLNEQEITELARLMLKTDALPVDVVPSLAREVGGSPYLLREYLLQLAEGGAEEAFGLTALPLSANEERSALPQTISHLYASRLGRLQPQERRILDVLSCFRAPVDLTLFEKIVHPSEVVLRDVFDRLTRSEILASHDSGTKYHFAHAQFRAYVYQNIDPSREEIHHIIAERLATFSSYDPEANFEKIAYHFQKAGERSKAHQYYLRAAAHAHSLSSYKEEIRLLEEALRSDEGKKEQPSMLEQLAEGYAHVASYAKASSLYQHLLDRDDLPAPRKFVYLKSLGRIQMQQGLLEEALRSFMEASRLVASVEEKIEIEGDLVAIDISRGHYKQARQRCMRVLESIEDRRSYPGLSDLLNKLGVICFYENHHEDAAQYFLEAIRLLHSTGSKDKLVHAYMNLGNVYSAREYFSDAERHWRTALALSKEVGNLEQEAQIYNNLGIANYAQEKHPQALEYYSQSLEIFRRLGNLTGEAYCRTNIGEVHFAEAEYEKAMISWQRSLSLYQSLQDEQGLVETHNQLTQVFLVVGNFGEAEQHLNEAFRIIESRVIESQRGTYYLLRGILEESQGRYDRAHHFVTIAEEFFRRIGDEKNHCSSLLRLGHLERLRGRGLQGAELLRRALEASTQKKYARLRSEVLYELGSLAEESSFPGKQAPLSYYKLAFDGLQQQSIGEPTWKVCLALARAYRTRGLAGKANESALQGKKSLEYLVSLFSDETLRSHYLSSDHRAEAVKEFEHLSELIQ